MKIWWYIISFPQCIQRERVEKTRCIPFRMKLLSILITCFWLLVPNCEWLFIMKYEESALRLAVCQIYFYPCQAGKKDTDRIQKRRVCSCYDLSCVSWDLTFNKRIEWKSFDAQIYLCSYSQLINILIHLSESL
jgi:hypothetical protein